MQQQLSVTAFSAATSVPSCCCNGPSYLIIHFENNVQKYLEKNCLLVLTCQSLMCWLSGFSRITCKYKPSKPKDKKCEISPRRQVCNSVCSNKIILAFACIVWDIHKHNTSVSVMPTNQPNKGKSRKNSQQVVLLQTYLRVPNSTSHKSALKNIELLSNSLRPNQRVAWN
jgi:hypothetical protein